MPVEMDSIRKLRPKERKVYIDDADDDEIEGGKRTFSVEEKLESDNYNNDDLIIMNGDELTVKYFQENGLKKPILVKEKTGLGMRVPGENFTVADVRQCVGSRRIVDVMDVNTQIGMEMTMKEWVNYYLSEEKEKLLNVISLEFSHTRLENYVEQPAVVRQIDWVDTVWPPYLKECQVETTNILDKMKYPKVQKYCLMSIRGCYTDFHIDMGGTSVWYHVLHGAKVFWLIPPTEQNLDIFERWTKSGRQGDVFFGDKVKDCMKICLEPGNTFFIPTGWIHAVYTTRDSLVFGGNFLHSFGIPMQLCVWDIESRTHVPLKFRYPFYTEIHWYVLDQYLKCLSGKSYRIKSEQEIKMEREQMKEEVKEDEDKAAELNSSLDDTTLVKNESQNNHTNGLINSSKLVSRRSSAGEHTPVSVKQEKCALKANGKQIEDFPQDKKKEWIHLTKYELEGLHFLVQWLEQLPPTKRLVPKDIDEPDLLLKDMKVLLDDHRSDNHVDACTGESVIKWPASKKAKLKVRGYTSCFSLQKRPKTAKAGGGSSGIRRRRVRCKKCEPCTRTDCRICSFCKDMRKYGGPGRMKQSCISRQCIRPELPSGVSCLICNAAPTEDKSEDNILMECGICWEIVHPKCHREKYNLSTEGVINEDLPNSWECPKCVEEGKHGQLKPRIRPVCKIVPQQDSCPDSSPTRSLQDSDQENKTVSSPLTPQSTVDEEKVEKGMVSCRMAVKEVPKPDEYRDTKKSGKKRPCDLDISERKVLRVELYPLKDCRTVQHLTPKSEKRESLPDDKVTKTSSPIARSHSVKKPALPTTRVTSRGREINIPSRFLR